MPRFSAINPENAAGRAKELLDGVQATLGMIPNLIRTMACSPAVLEAYLSFTGALAMGSLPATLREQIALTVAEVNDCHYSLAAHSAVGKVVGLSHQDILDSRQGTSPDRRVDAALQFARTVILQRGRVDDADVARLRRAEFDDAEITEVVANVALNLFSNYFNHVADTVVDFPEVKSSAARRSGPGVHLDPSARATTVWRCNSARDTERTCGPGAGGKPDRSGVRSEARSAPAADVGGARRGSPCGP